MAEEASAPVSPNAELLKWPNQDKRRLLYAAYSVGDLDRSIKFYTEALGMKLLSRKQVPEEKHSYAFLGFGPEESQFVVQLTYNHGVNSSHIRNGFGHLGIETPYGHKLVENIRVKGGEIVMEPTLFKMDGSDYWGAVVKDSDGCSFELIQRDSSSRTPQPLNHVTICVADLDRSIQFYEKALGMRLIKKIDKSEHQLAMATLEYAHENSTAILELMDRKCDGAQYHNENSDAQVTILTEDVYKSAEVVNLVTKELGGKLTGSPGLPLPGTSKSNTKIGSFMDPDGCNFVLIDNGDFLEELKSSASEDAL